MLIIAKFSLFLQCYINDSIMKLNNLKEVLEKKGISQTWLAKKLGKSFSAVNGYCTNRTQPGLEVLNAIADILQIDVKDLVTSHKERELNERPSHTMKMKGKRQAVGAES